MSPCLLLSMLLALGCVHVRAAPTGDAAEPASCKNPQVLGAAELALKEINKDRKEGYVFALAGVSNAHMANHEETGNVFYLTLNVEETNCSVLTKKSYKECEVRQAHSTPVYGQCKVIMYISRVHRAVHLYSYNCVVRPAPASKLHMMCPDCPSLIDSKDDSVKATVSAALDKFNKESGLANHFALLHVNRATSGYMMSAGMFYNVEFAIQETTCAQGTEAADKCPLMDCEFAHKGFCKGSMYPTLNMEKVYDVDCEIFEPEAAQKELKVHQSNSSDHAHDDATAPAGAGGAEHTHHWHTHSHDSVHAHHDKAHDHAGDTPNKHHDYKHADGEHNHQHDHEIALDHDHKHAHLHGHEHHHHHHHPAGTHTAAADPPEGLWHTLPSMGNPSDLTAFPDMPAITGAGPQLPQGVPAPTLQAFPSSQSAECPTEVADDASLAENLIAEDALFKA